jgi:lipase chaperone LimK
VGTRLALGAGTAVALGLVWWLAASRPEPASDPPVPGRAASGSSLPAVPSDAATGAALPALPASLAGTEVDGGFVVDADGLLVVRRDALDLFDYFLAASGEEPLSVIRVRITREIESRLRPEAQPAALDLLERYLAYREALRSLFESEDLANQSLERRFQRIRELRREHFRAHEREVLFAAEEERWRVDLERQRIAKDPDLAPEERAARLAALDAELPDDVRQAREIALAAVALREDEASLRAAGASDAEIHALREQRFGAEAADRLAALDQRRVRWERRVDAWRDERAQLLEAGATAEEIAERRARRFEGPELRRLEAVERIEASPKP